MIESAVENAGKLRLAIGAEKFSADARLTRYQLLSAKITAYQVGDGPPPTEEEFKLRLADVHRVVEFKRLLCGVVGAQAAFTGMKQGAGNPKSILLWAWVMGLLLVSGSVIAKERSHWLTVVGTPGEPNHYTIEVQPASIATTPNRSSLNIRVNRSTPISSSEGIPFRSYTATILIDCSEKTARFTTADFYMMPMCKGKAHQTVAWSAAEVRPVLFRNFKPNPRDRIIRAACNNAMR